MSPGQALTWAHGSAMHMLPQHTVPGLQPPAHWFTTQVPIPSTTVHFSPGAHSLCAHGSGTQAPLTQIWPLGQLAQGAVHFPLRSQNWPLGQVTPKQGSCMQVGGLPTQIWPAGHGIAWQVWSTQTPRSQTKPVGQLTRVQGSTQLALPSVAVRQTLPAGHFVDRHWSGTQSCTCGSQTKPPGHGNSVIMHGVTQAPM